MTSPATLSRSLQGKFLKNSQAVSQETAPRCEFQSRLLRNSIPPPIFLISSSIAGNFEVLEGNPIAKYPHDLTKVVLSHHSWSLTRSPFSFNPQTSSLSEEVPILIL